MFHFKDHKVELHQDLPSEAVARRWEFKEISRQLTNERIRYKWSGAEMLIVFHKGESLKASSVSVEEDHLFFFF